MVKVFISGLTAAGKTTHAKLLASHYNLRYISASNFLLKRANIDIVNLPKNFWVSHAASSLQSQRYCDQSIDTWVDQQMAATAIVADNAIFDSWGLPCLSMEPGLRIWLESSNQSRWWKAIISQGFDTEIGPNETLAEMNKKDDFTRKYFLLNYGFDILQDHHKFDYILDITNFISAPTYEASKLSISKSQELITAVVKYHTTRSKWDLIKLCEQVRRHGKGIFKKIPSELGL
jgi:cytidylate kinase